MQKFKTVDDLVNQLKPEGPVYCIRKKPIQVASKTFQNKFPGKILYAVKTNPHPEVLKTITKSGINNFDVASIKEIENVSSLGVKINIDNLSILEEFGNKNSGIDVCVRINPHILAGGNSKISVGHIDSKFGMKKDTT